MADTIDEHCDKHFPETIFYWELPRKEWTGYYANCAVCGTTNKLQYTECEPHEKTRP